MIAQEILFRVGVKHGKKHSVKFNILHNLRDFGLELEDQFEKWLMSNPGNLEDPYEFCSYILAHAKPTQVAPGKIAARPIRAL